MTDQPHRRRIDHREAAEMLLDAFAAAPLAADAATIVAAAQAHATLAVLDAQQAAIRTAIVIAGGKASEDPDSLYAEISAQQRRHLVQALR